MSLIGKCYKSKV